ncbi:MAG: fluoride efflux transporter CrcB [Solirubrobacteraceae bacterium]|nr:fluoride efflux transporter CrcB [Solirubrobacteraceae bacterium]
MPVIGRAHAAAVFAGGAAGALARVALAEAVPAEPGTWPWATLVANVAGAALLGWLLVRLAEAPADHGRRPLLTQGLCGGLTTFSTLQLELFDLLDAGRPALAAAYAAVSLALGMGAIALGARLAGREAPA